MLPAEKDEKQGKRKAKRSAFAAELFLPIQDNRVAAVVLSVIGSCCMPFSWDSKIASSSKRYCWLHTGQEGKWSAEVISTGKDSASVILALVSSSPPLPCNSFKLVVLPLIVLRAFMSHRVQILDCTWLLHGSESAPSYSQGVITSTCLSTLLLG